jgi:hypothetical protein
MCHCKYRYFLLLRSESVRKNSAATKIQKAIRGSRTRTRYLDILRSQYSIKDPELDELLDGNEVDSMLVDILCAADEDEGKLDENTEWVPSIPKIFKVQENLDEKNVCLERNSEDEVHLMKNKPLSNQQLIGEWKITDHRVLEVSSNHGIRKCPTRSSPLGLLTNPFNAALIVNYKKAR